MLELFIYYRVASRNAAALHAAVMQRQAQWRRDVPGLVARLLVRSDESDGVQTWMETYSTRPDLLPDGIDAALDARLVAAPAAEAALVEGDRHVERFRACAS